MLFSVHSRADQTLWIQHSVLYRLIWCFKEDKQVRQWNISVFSRVCVTMMLLINGVNWMLTKRMRTKKTSHWETVEQIVDHLIWCFAFCKQRQRTDVPVLHILHMSHAMLKVCNDGHKFSVIFSLSQYLLLRIIHPAKKWTALMP